MAPLDFGFTSSSKKLFDCFCEEELKLIHVLCSAMDNAHMFSNGMRDTLAKISRDV